MGPTVGIWLPVGAAPREPELLTIACSLDPTASSSTEISIATTVPIGGSTDTEDDPRPFGFHLAGVGFEGDKLAAVQRAFGFMPASAVNVFAYANAPIDHRVLAELAIFFAQRFNGIIDYGGNLGRVRLRSGKLMRSHTTLDRSRQRSTFPMLHSCEPGSAIPAST